MNLNTPFSPIEAKFLEEYLSSLNIDLEKISIRELSRLVDELSDKLAIEFLRFEFGIPGIRASSIGPNEEMELIKNNPDIFSTYPPFDGIQRLKKSTSRFINNFLDIDVPSSSCIPTVGAMHGGFICQSIAGRIRKESSKILYLDPGFPVNKLQTKFLGLQSASIDLYDNRGEKLLESIEKQFLSLKRIFFRFLERLFCRKLPKKKQWPQELMVFFHTLHYLQS